MRAGVLNSITSLVGELAKVHFPRMTRKAQHVNVGAGAEDSLPGAGDNHASHLGMLEPNPLQRVVQLDIHAQVIRVQLKLVSGTDSSVLLHIQEKRGAAALDGEAPMPV